MSAQATRRTYRWWPAFHPTPLEVSDVRALPRLFLSVGLVTGALCLPPVTRATGVRPSWVIALISAHLAWALLTAFVINPVRKTTPRRFHISLAGAVLLNSAIVVAIPTLGGEPRTPLWMIAAMYACFNGAIQEIEPSIGVLAIHVVMPLAAIPFLLQQGADPTWSVVAPLLCSAVSVVGYNHLAHVSARWLEHRRQQARALAALRSDLQEHEQIRIARDLHDSVGSNLAIVGLYGDLIERHVDRPDDLRAVASMVRDAASAGIEEFSALLSAMTPAAIDLDGLAASVSETARRATQASGAIVDVRVVRGGDTKLAGAVRLALVRISQEALNNALRHGQAQRVDICFATDHDIVTLEVADHGSGFSIQDVSHGRGLVGMRARASELGGNFSVSSSPGSGSRVSVSLPRGEASLES